MGSKRLSITDEKENNMCLSYKNGLSCKKIGIDFGISESSVERILKINNIILRKSGKKKGSIPWNLGLTKYTNSSLFEMSKIYSKFTKEQEKQICELYLQGLNPNEIASKFGVLRGIIGRILENNHIKLRSLSEALNIRPNEHENKICDLYNQGMAMQIIGRNLHISSKTIKKILLRNNIQIRTISKALLCSTKNKVINSQEIENKICNMYKERKTMKQISENFHVSISSIKRILQNNNIKIVHPKRIELDQKVMNKIFKLYRGGLTLDRVAKSMNCSCSLIKRILKENNIHIRSYSEVFGEGFGHRRRDKKRFSWYSLNPIIGNGKKVIHGYQRHHVNHKDIIYIPENYNKNIPHNLITGYNMEVVNTIAYFFLVMNYIQDLNKLFEEY